MRETALTETALTKLQANSIACGQVLRLLQILPFLGRHFYEI